MNVMDELNNLYNKNHRAWMKELLQDLNGTIFIS